MYRWRYTEIFRNIQNSKSYVTSWWKALIIIYIFLSFLILFWTFNVSFFVNEYDLKRIKLWCIEKQCLKNSNLYTIDSKLLFTVWSWCGYRPIFSCGLYQRNNSSSNVVGFSLFRRNRKFGKSSAILERGAGKWKQS